jgi:farnesol dehydrogenase
MRLAAGLRRERHDVTALVRSRGRAAALEALGVKLVEGDVTALREAVIDYRSFDACVHGAAVVKVRGAGPREFDLTNVAGVAAVAERFLDAGVRRFLYTSSFMALGPSPDGSPLDETALHDPFHVHNDYERTKHLGLLEFESWASRGLPGIALIPCVVYGPGAITSGNLVSKVVADIIRGKFPGVLGDGRTVWTYSFVEDVVEGHLAALEKGRPGERYILGGESVTMERFVAMAAGLAGVEAPRRHIPFWVAKAGAFVEETLATARRREPQLSRQVVEIYRHHWVYSSAKAQRDLGYRITPLMSGLAQTISWVRTQIEQGKL